MSSVTRMVRVDESALKRPTSVGGSVLWAANAEPAATPCAASAMVVRTLSRSAAAAPGSVRSTTARAQPRDRLPIRRMSPLGMT